MSPQRGTETEQLFQIIEVIQLGRKTGMLYVERDYQSRVETGRIQFAHGQISDARGGLSGELTGIAAIRWFRTWGHCRFFFLPTGAQSHTLPLTAQSTQPLMALGSEEYSPVLSNSESRLQSVEVNTPRLTQQIEQGLALLERAGFSRIHRRLLLLIDGKRTTLEIARLVGRKPEELQQMLNDLARLGVIS